MKTSTAIPILLLILTQAWLTKAEEENLSLEDPSAGVPLDHLLRSQTKGAQGKEEEGEEEEEKIKKFIEGDEDNSETSISDVGIVGMQVFIEDPEGASLPKPEALQGSPQALQGLHITRIPPTCSLCSRERNLCRIISGIFTRSPLPYGYSLVTPIPAGVCNLSITEMKPSKNFFALRRPDGSYVLNGNWDIQAAGQYLIGGTTFTYTPSSENNGEQLAAPGPLREPIELMLISQSPNPGIKYEYRVPVQEYLSGTSTGITTQTGGLLPNMGGLRGGLGQPPPSFPQETSNIGSNIGSSIGSNIGSRNPAIGIRNPGSGTGSTAGGIPSINNPSLVPGQLPYGPNNPNIVASNFGPLNPGGSSTGGLNRGRGISGSFNPANVPIQRGSSQARGSAGIPGVIPHIQPITPLGTTSQSSPSLPLPWNPSFSAHDGSQVPSGNPYSPNQGFPRNPTGGVLPTGFSRPGIPGQQPADGVRPKLPGSGNTGVQGITPQREGTNIPGIPPDFPQNSVPLRPIAIPINPNTGSRRPSGIPGQSRRPQLEELDQNNPSRRVQSSGTHRIRHHHGEKRRQGFRKTSGTSAENIHETPFGIGIQQTQPNITPSSFPSSSNEMTTVKAPRRRGNGGRRRQQQNDSGSSENGGRRKQRSRYQWAEKGFTQCTKPCGGGNQTTILSCERRRKKTVVPDRRCDHLPRPKTHTIMCNLKPCPAAWAPGDWGPCSVTCGMGVQTRPLVCKQEISPTFTMMVPEGACLSPPSVATSQVCEIGKCPSTSPEWDVGPWTNCSAPCGLGSRTREVQCFLGGTPVPDDTCSLDTKPLKEQVCDMGSCATNTWFFSEWSSQCSETCGTGLQTRKVHCLTSGLSPGGECTADNRPEASRTCLGENGCGGQWFTGPWGDCSTSCGVGRETRSVICVVVTKKGRWKVLEDEQCFSQTRPHDSQECNVEPCGPQWYTSTWSECSASCEGGIKRREVTCLDANLRPSADCFNASKPDSREPCRLHPCNATETPMETSFLSYSPTTVSSVTTSVITNTYTEAGERGDPGTPVTEDKSIIESQTQSSHVKINEEDDDADGEDEDEAATEIHPEESEEIENDLVVEEVSGSALNVIPDKDAQGDESVAGDEDENDDADRDDDEEAEKKKKKKRKKNKESESTEAKEEGLATPSSIERSSCIDRIKNCHLVFRARLCRLKYYNKLCCRTCSAS